MGGFHLFDHNTPLAYLTPDNVLDLIRQGLIIPPTRAEIKDRSKGDAFSKSIVLVQTLWFVMQCIARHLEHLPITELEIATLAYTIPILGIYICWWNKPLGVIQPIQVQKHMLGDITVAQDTSWLRSFLEAFTGKRECYQCMCV